MIYFILGYLTWRESVCKIVSIWRTINEINRPMPIPWPAFLPRVTGAIHALRVALEVSNPGAGKKPGYTIEHVGFSATTGGESIR